MERWEESMSTAGGGSRVEAWDESISALSGVPPEMVTEDGSELALRCGLFV